MRIVCDANMPGIEALAAAGVDLCACPGRAITRDQLVGAEALLVRSVTRVDSELLRDTAVRFVGTATAGTDHIDREALADRGIAFADAAGANANAVVEYVLAALAVCGTRLEELLDGGRVGIAGYGHVGRALGARLTALGIDWIAADPWLPAGTIPHPAGDLDELCRCEVVTLHTSLADRPPWPSRHLFGPRRLAALPPGALLINASRGPVVDNAALEDWLRTGRGAAVLDVWETEPLVPEALRAATAIGTPHIAGYSLDARLAGTRCVLRAMDLALGTELAGGVIQPPQTPLELPTEEGRARALRTLLLSRYDPRSDSARMAQVLAEAGEERAAAFDGLRRDYGVRRELAGAPARGGSEEARALAQALGCVRVD
jgi:erythronate-4-phosphate dehydrogenase